MTFYHHQNNQIQVLPMTYKTPHASAPCTHFDIISYSFLLIHIVLFVMFMEHARCLPFQDMYIHCSLLGRLLPHMLAWHVHSVCLGLCSTALPQRGIFRAPPTSSVSPKPSFHVFLPHTTAWDYIKLFLIIYSLSPQLEYKLRKGSIPILSIFKCSQDVSNAQSSLRTISLKGSREFNLALSSYSHHDLFTGKKKQRSLASGGLLS